MTADWVLPISPPHTEENIRASVEVCRGDFIRAESAEDTAQCIRFHSRARLVFEGIDPVAVWEAIKADRAAHPAAWASWRRYWDGVLAHAAKPESAA